MDGCRGERGLQSELVAANNRRKYCLLFIRLFGRVWEASFQQVPMPHILTSVPGCIEHERLEFELSEVRMRGQYLTRLRSLSPYERAEWDRRESKALAELVDHELEHGCNG